jgi:hypothetical protein
VKGGARRKEERYEHGGVAHAHPRTDYDGSWPIGCAIRRHPARSIPTGETAMKINEDWLSVIFAFVLLILALVGVIGGSWMIF